MALSETDLLRLADEALRRREELMREQRATEEQIETLAMALGIQPVGLANRRQQLESRVQEWRGRQLIAISS